MNKQIFDITLKKNRSYNASEEFIRSYFKSSYYHFTFLTSEYDIESYNNAVFNGKTMHEKIGLNFLNLNSVINLLKLSYIINKKAKPIVFLHGFTSPLHVIILKLFCKKSVKFLVQHHAEKPYQNGIRLYLQKLAYQDLSAYVFASEKLADQYILKNVIRKTARLCEVMEGSTSFTLKDTQLWKKNPRKDQHKTFIWVGRLDKNKDPLTAIKAFKLYKEWGAEFILKMVFNGNELESEVRDYISEQKLENSVVMIGQKTHEDLEELYGTSDFFISASHYEGSGYAFCESMACECIPIVTNIPSFYTMTHGGMFGKLFKVGDYYDLFKKLVECEDLNLAIERIKVKNHFDEHLSFRAIARKMDQLFNDLNI